MSCFSVFIELYDVIAKTLAAHSFVVVWLLWHLHGISLVYSVKKCNDFSSLSFASFIRTATHVQKLEVRAKRITKNLDAQLLYGRRKEVGHAFSRLLCLPRFFRPLFILLFHYFFFYFGLHGEDIKLSPPTLAKATAVAPASERLPVCLTRRALSQFLGFKIRHTTFLNCIKFFDPRILTL